MHIPFQGGYVIQPFHMLLAVEHRLVQVGGGPPKGHMEIQHLGELLCRGAGTGVPPGAEGYQQGAVTVKGQVAVHHGADARSGQLLQGDAVLCLHLCLQGCIATLQAFVNVLQAIGPDAVFQPVFPVVCAHGQGVALSVHQHGLDPRGAKLNAQHGLTGLNEGARRILIHGGFLLKRKSSYISFSTKEYPFPTTWRKKNALCAEQRPADFPLASACRKSGFPHFCDTQ